MRGNAAQCGFDFGQFGHDGSQGLMQKQDCTAKKPPEILGGWDNDGILRILLRFAAGKTDFVVARESGGFAGNFVRIRAENVQFVMAASALLGDGVALKRASAAVKPAGGQFDIAEAAQTGN